MLVIDILRLSTRMFRTNRSRTILTILGISVGIGAILFLVSLGYGLQQLILNRITTSDALLSLDVTTADVSGLRMNSESEKQISAITGVDKTSPMVTSQAQIRIDDISSELLMNFVNHEFFLLDGTVLKKGNFYTDEFKDKNKIIISSAALQLFNLSEEDAFGKIVKFTIFVSGDEEAQEKITRSFVELEQEFKIIGIDNYSKIKVKADKKENLDIIRESIIDKGFMVSALSDIIEQANQIFKVVQIVLASFGIVALIVSAIGMFNTMTIALLERTQEIGIMKALGATSLDIWNMFLAESVIIGFFGGLGGIMIGLAGGEAFNYAVNLLAGALGGEKIDMFFTPYWFVLLIISFSTFVGLITGFYPARRAANISALEALRYK